MDGTSHGVPSDDIMDGISQGVRSGDDILDHISQGVRSGDDMLHHRMRCGCARAESET